MRLRATKSSCIGNGAVLPATNRIFPQYLYENGEQGFFYDMWETTYLFQDDAGTIPVVSDNDPVGLVVDISGVGINATQSIAGNKPLYKTSGPFVDFNGGKSIASATLDAIPDGYYVLATVGGVVAYKLAKTAGSFNIPRNFMPEGYVLGSMVIDRPLSSTEINEIYTYFVNAGASSSGNNAYGAITNMSSYWRGWTYIKEFPIIDTSSCTNATSAWLGCVGLTSFPLLDFSSCTILNQPWRNCTGLTSFPAINTSNCTDMGAAWLSCTGLTSFPSINTALSENMNSTWEGCSGLTSFPVISLASAIFSQSTWKGCSSLVTFPTLDYSGCIFMSSMFENCSSMTTFPFASLSTTNTTVLNNLFQGCALDQTSVNGVLTTIDAKNSSGGSISVAGGTNSPPSAIGQSAIFSLRDRSWTVSANGENPLFSSSILQAAGWLLTNSILGTR